MTIPYQISEVIKKSDQRLFSVISTFAGCGGSSLGYKLSGGHVLCVNEFISAAQDTYSANFPETPILKEDIRNLCGQDFLNVSGIQVGQLDILDGSPPCASFSSSGKVDKLWGKVKKYSDTKQRTDDLFFEFTRILREIQPKAFVTENVKGLLRGKAKEFFLSQILPEMRNCGYKVFYSILNSSDFGVPQDRERLICVGIRNDIDKDFTFSNPKTEKVSVSQAFENLIQDEEQRQFLLEAGTRYANSRKWHEISIGESHPVRFGTKRNRLHCPSFTLMAEDSKLNAAGVMHPTECRRHTIPEAKRLMAFPEDFILTGTFQKQYERLARAVPPFLHASISKDIYDQILKCQ